MKPSNHRFRGHSGARTIGLGLLFGCLLLPVAFLVLDKHNSHQLAILSLQLSVLSVRLPTVLEESASEQPKPAVVERAMEKKIIGSLITMKPKKLGFVAFVGCLVVPLVLVSVLRPTFSPMSLLCTNLTSLALPLKAIQEQTGSVANVTSLSLPVKEIKEQADSIVNETILSLPSMEMQEHTDLVKQEGNNSNAAYTGIGVVEQTLDSKEKPGVNKSFIGSNTTELPLSLNVVENNTTVDEKGAEKNESLTQAPFEKQAQNQTSEEYQVSIENHQKNQTPVNGIVPESKLFCDRSERRSDTCSMLGDIRVLSKSSTILLAFPSQLNASTENSTLKIRPYARKWETPVMETIKELSLKQSLDAKDTPGCSVNHSIPAVIFSTGGFLGNIFHDFTDVLVPLFATSHQFQGEVQFLATNFNSKWIDRYQQILKQLSHYKIINMDTEDQVHCFREAYVGLKSHKVFGIDPSKTPNGYSMLDFKRFLRSSFSLNRESTKKIVKPSKKKPRLLMILRKGSRSLVNAKEVIKTARSIGYKVVTTAPEDTKDLSRYAQIVNSCDAMMGVHGAGLTNMVFLPTNASIIQITPCCGLKWACRHDFGEPAPDMGLNYIEYEIKEKESSLIEEYPRDHAVFKDPASIFKQGFNMLWSVYLDKQKVKLDVGRFRGVLLEVYQTLKQ